MNPVPSGFLSDSDMTVQKHRVRETSLKKMVFLAACILLYGLNGYAQKASVISAIQQMPHQLQPDPYQSRLFRVSGTPQLTVFTPSGDIEVVHNPDIDGVKVDLYVDRAFSLWPGSRGLDNYRILLQQQGNHIIATVEDKRGGTAGRMGNRFSFVVQVPRRVSTDLRSMHGNIFLEGVQGKQFLQTHLAGNVEVRQSEGSIQAATQTGEIRLEELKGNISAITLNGSIHIRKNTGEIRVKATNGNIDAGLISGTLISATTNGNIAASFEKVSQGIYLETVNGNITLEVPSYPGYNIRSEGLGFDLSGFSPSIISREIKNNREVTVVIRDGSLPVQLSTSAGHIQIKEIQ